ncbi:MAG: FAD-dependent oxidoreductase [Candidatus Omnitrophica bacterium]|nr:FAD-dependent oxidoreductase [Candidatus Omnitrophota bacterium]
MGIQDTRHFKLAFDPGTVFDFDAGQFVNILVEKDAKTIKRPYSIASPPSWKGFIDLCWKRVDGGLVTNLLWDYKKGDKLTIQGPLGRFTAHKPLPKAIIFISTGTGIAPFRSIFHELLREGTACEIWNIFGNRYDEDILYQKEFEELAGKHKNFHNIFTISRPKTWKGEKDYVQFMLKKYISNPADKHIYICGLTNMIQEVQKTALEIGFTKEQIFFEKYD